MTDQAAAGAGAAEILAVDEVSVSLSGRQILDNVSFTVGPGQFTGLNGPNGAGKTTLLRVILGLQRPWAIHRPDRPERGRQDDAAGGEPRPAAAVRRERGRPGAAAIPAEPVHRLCPAESPPG